MTDEALDGRLRGLMAEMKKRASAPKVATVENEDGIAVFRDEHGNMTAVMNWDDFVSLRKKMAAK